MKLTKEEKEALIRLAVAVAMFCIVIFLVVKYANAGDTTVPGKIIVKYKDGTSDSDKDLLRSTYKLTLSDTPSQIPNAEVLIITDGRSPEDTAALVATNQIVKYAEPVYVLKPQGTLVPNDFGYKYQWYMNQITMPAAWDYMKYDVIPTSLWVKPKIAIIDTGIVMGNLDLPYANIVYGCDWTYAGATCNRPVDDTTNWSHGTAIAGIVAAYKNNGVGMAGMDSNITLLIEKICKNEVCGTDASANAIYHAVNAGAKVINLSFGGYDYSAAQADALQYAAAHNVLVVCAAGNEGNYNVVYPYYPAILPECMTVGATKKDDTIVSVGDDAPVAWGSNWGNNISVVAPGIDIYSLDNDEYYSVIQWRGTSFSAAQVTGLAGMLLYKCQTIGAGRIRALIESGALNVGQDYLYGKGRIRAIKSISEPCTPPVSKDVWCNRMHTVCYPLPPRPSRNGGYR